MMLRQHTTKYLLLQLAAVLLCIHAIPQDPNNQVAGLIADIFSTTNRPSRAGANDIVTPVPNDPSQPSIQFQSITGKAQCNCVPYHLCDSSTGAVQPEEEVDYPKIDIRFNADDPVCEHFLDVCCDRNKTRAESVPVRPQEERPNRPTGCGIRNVGGIDLNLVDAKDNESGFGEFPWTVALLHSSNVSYFCTGSLIHPQVVLTAAHCVIQRPVTSFMVRAGEWDTQTEKERLPFVERNVRKIITHPQFNSRNVANDFALVILSDALTLGDHINVICLPAQDAGPAIANTCYSTGWGKDVFGAKGRFSAVMKRVALPIVDFDTCQTRLRGTRLSQKFNLHRSFICAGGQPGIDTCQGDGGAPLACPVGPPLENRYEQSGIVSWGIGCKDAIPAAYASVALARNWIDEQMLTNGFPTSSYSPL